MIHYYYGYGKGKTTAAMGLSLRALGRGKRVVIVQFLKDMPTGEVTLLEGLPNVTVLRGKAGKGFTFTMTDAEKAETARIHNQNLAEGIARARRGDADLLVLDEIGDAVDLSLVDTDLLLDFLRAFHDKLEIAMTGHAPTPALLALADYVTEMVKHRHPYDQGVKARIGVEL